MRFAIIGAGKFAEKRANVIGKGLDGKGQLKAVVDIDFEKARALAQKKPAVRRCQIITSF
jgi:predicted dehydrogenase